MELLYLFAGILIGAVTSWLIARSQFTNQSGIDPVQFQELDKQNAVLAQQRDDAYSQIRQHETDLKALRDQSNVFIAENTKWKSAYENLDAKLKSQKQDLELLQQQMKEQFSNIASDIVFRNSQKIQEEHQVKLNDILSPLKDKIEKFESQVKTTHEERIREHQSMREQLSQLQTLNKSIGDEARNLVTALKGQSKTQGNWGEMILEKVLERSGLMKGREYSVQSSMVNEDGRRLQPDVLIHLPEGRTIVVDSKVSLIAYERYSSAEDTAQKELFLKEHISSIRKHIKDLSSKNYQHLYAINTLDFVLLFIPIEPAFSLAADNDAELFNEAFERNIVLVTTSTLLATLRTIASIWRLEYQNKNSLEIARQAADLYDKFTGLVDDLMIVGNKIKDAGNSYETSMNKLVSGRGNLISRVENMKKLGLKTSKQMNQKLIERTDDLESTEQEPIKETSE
ncbi:DNA recombination protein RmuC [soil metagenome]